MVIHRIRLQHMDIGQSNQNIIVWHDFSCCICMHVSSPVKPPNATLRYQLRENLLVKQKNIFTLGGKKKEECK